METIKIKRIKWKSIILYSNINERKYSLDELNNRLEMTAEWVSNLEVRTLEINPNWRTQGRKQKPHHNECEYSCCLFPIFFINYSLLNLASFQCVNQKGSAKCLSAPPKAPLRHCQFTMTTKLSRVKSQPTPPLLMLLSNLHHSHTETWCQIFIKFGPS